MLNNRIVQSICSVFPDHPRNLRKEEFPGGIMSAQHQSRTRTTTLINKENIQHKNLTLLRRTRERNLEGPITNLTNMDDAENTNPIRRIAMQEEATYNTEIRPSEISAAIKIMGNSAPGIHIRSTPNLETSH